MVVTQCGCHTVGLSHSGVVTRCGCHTVGLSLYSILVTVSITQRYGEEPGNEVTLIVLCDKDSAANYMRAVM